MNYTSATAVTAEAVAIASVARRLLPVREVARCFGNRQYVQQYFGSDRQLAYPLSLLSDLAGTEFGRASSPD